MSKHMFVKSFSDLFIANTRKSPPILISHTLPDQTVKSNIESAVE